MIPVSLILHGNLQYAEIPTSEIKNIVEKSYIPTLDLLLNNKNIKSVIDFSGVTLEILAKDYPLVIKKIRKLIEVGNVELLGSTYANPILPLIPLENARRQISEFEKTFEKLFGDLKFKPVGFFPQEYFIDASIISVLSELGYKWVPVHGIQLINSSSGKFNNVLKNPLTNVDIAKNPRLFREIVYPFRIIGAKESQIYGFGIFDKFAIDRLHEIYEEKINWSDYLGYLDELSREEEITFIFLGPSDMEFIGHFSFEGHKPIDPLWLESFCKRLLKTGKFEFSTPKEYLSKNKINRELYLKSGGDHENLDIWTKDTDNERLNILCSDATNLLSQTEAQLNIFENLGYDTRNNRTILAEGWKALMLAENSDGRGWNPIPERRLFCYNNAILAIKKAKEAGIISITYFQNSPSPK